MKGRGWALVAVLSACAGPPGAPSPGHSTVWGYVRLVPLEGVQLPSGASSSYADRRLRDVEYVDYSSPGFAVVYLEGSPPPQGETRVSVQSTRFGTRLVPEQSVVGLGGSVVVVNQTSEAQIVSAPSWGLLQELQPGEETSIIVSESGAGSIHVMGQRVTDGFVFVAPGEFAVPSNNGRFEIPDVTPGRADLHAWHARFPPARRAVEAIADRLIRVDLELGVGAPEGPDQ